MNSTEREPTTSPRVNVVTMSQLKSSGRLDAEFHMREHYANEDRLNSLPGGSRYLHQLASTQRGSVISDTQRPERPEEEIPVWQPRDLFQGHERPEFVINPTLGHQRKERAYLELGQIMLHYQPRTGFHIRQVTERERGHLARCDITIITADPLEIAPEALYCLLQAPHVALQAQRHHRGNSLSHDCNHFLLPNLTDAARRQLAENRAQLHKLQDQQQLLEQEFLELGSGPTAQQ